MVGLLGIENGFALRAQKLIELTDAALVQADDLAIDDRALHGQPRET